MKRYQISITETLKHTVEVTAKNQEEAEQIVADRWKHGEYILDAEDFTDVDFERIPVKL